MLFEQGEVTVYRHSDVPIPDDVIAPSDFFPVGVIFAGNRMYGIPIPYVLSMEYPVAEEDGRDPDPIEILKYSISVIAEKSAEDILLSIRTKWKYRSEWKADTWYPLCALIDKVSGAEIINSHFLEQSSYLICVGYIDRKDTNKIKRREIAESWLSRQPRYETVMEHFRLLGVPTIEAVCAEQGGFAGTEFEDPED